MKHLSERFLVILLFLSLGSFTFAQNNPIDFETGGFGASWTWTVFENGTNPPLEIVPNPDTQVNTSATVAKFTALQAGFPYAGVESQHGTDLGTFTLDQTNSTIKIMVWKPVISDVGIKLVRADGDALPEIKVANTVANAWEELTFDFSSRIGHPSTIGIDQIVVFPDFTARTADNICYFDNITFSQMGSSTSGPTLAAPVPTANPSNVMSIFSDTYTDLPNTNFNPNWGQATVVTQPNINGNVMLKYAGLNYQGTNLGSIDGTPQNFTAYSYLHVDYWTADATALQFFLIEPGPNERSYDFTVIKDTWVSTDIPLSNYTSQGLPIDSIYQFKVVGDGTVFLDNIYFSTVVSDVEEVIGAVPSEYSLGQNYPNPFNPSTKINFSLPEASNVKLTIFNTLGQEVATLLNDYMNAGSYEYSFDASDMTSGIYFYSITTGEFFFC
jgi:hypothetical protein